MDWTNRKVVSGLWPVAGRRSRASWAAVALALCSLGVQVTNFVRVDLKPLLEAAKQNTETLQRIETRLEDHERRLADLERWRK